jgi:hypothetical protein
LVELLELPDPPQRASLKLRDTSVAKVKCDGLKSVARSFTPAPPLARDQALLV